MADVETLIDETVKEDGYVTHIRVRHTTDDKYPSGWDYTLHFGTLDGDTILRYDNAHERTQGHDRHTTDGVEEIEFPGMSALIQRFRTERKELKDEHSSDTH